MAILNDLIVRGSSRLLNKLYCKDIVSDGSLSVSGGLNVSGGLTVTGRSTMNDGINVGYTNTSYQISAASIICQSWLRTVGNAGWYSETYGGGWYMTDSTYIRNYNNRALLLSANLYMGGTTYYFNTSGIINASTVTTNGANIGTLNCTTKAEFLDVNVKNTLRSVKWDINNVANLGGTFYVAPTLYFSANTSVIVNSISGTSVTLTITDATTISSSTAAGVTWYANSKIKLSGKIGNCVLGTADGTLSATMHSTANTLKCVVNIVEASKLTAGTTYSAANVSNLCVMMYSLYSSVSGTSAARPVGIAMTSYGANKSSAIDIYGGTSDTPNVRIGLLTGISDSALSPSGWGIYASNGYFKGKIVATSGKIGNFNISTRLYTNNNDFNNSVSNSNVYIGENGISLGKGQFKVTDAGALTATSANITGILNATGGKIGGWTISGKNLIGETGAIFKNGILQSNSFVEDTSGVQIDLDTGIIKGNIKATTMTAIDEYRLSKKNADIPIIASAEWLNDIATFDIGLNHMGSYGTYSAFITFCQPQKTGSENSVDIFGDAITIWGKKFSVNAPIGTGQISITGDATVGKTLKVTGAATLSSSLGVSGAVTCKSTLSVSKTSSFAGVATFKTSTAFEGAMVTKYGAFEMNGKTPYIDFHYNNSTADFTSRIIAVGNGQLNIGGGLWGFIRVDGANGYLRPEVNGNFSLGNTSYRYDTVYVTSVNNSSLLSLKTEIAPMQNALSEISKTDVYNYKLKAKIARNGDDVIHTGFVIGDGYKISDSIVADSGDGIDLYSAIGVTFAGVKELHELVKKQQETILKLNEKLERLEGKAV